MWYSNIQQYYAKHQNIYENDEGVSESNFLSEGKEELKNSV